MKDEEDQTSGRYLEEEKSLQNSGWKTRTGVEYLAHDRDTNPGTVTIAINLHFLRSLWNLTS
jgi:hypothetical protein